MQRNPRHARFFLNELHNDSMMPPISLFFPPKVKSVPISWHECQLWSRIWFHNGDDFHLDLTVPQLLNCFVHTLRVHKWIVSDLLNLLTMKKTYFSVSSVKSHTKSASKAVICAIVQCSNGSSTEVLCYKIQRLYADLHISRLNKWKLKLNIAFSAPQINNCKRVLPVQFQKTWHTVRQE